MEKYSFFNRLLLAYNQLDRRVIIFIFLSLSFLSFILHHNEEFKLGIAKFYMDKDWLPACFSFDQDDPTKIFFNIIAGSLLRIMTFEQVAFFGKLASYILFSFVLGNFFGISRLSNLKVSVILLIYFDHQSILGGGSVFNTFEPKTIAYVFVFQGIYCLFKNKLIIAGVLFALATYFHILLGAWVVFASGIFLVVRRTTMKNIFLFSACYIGLVVPFILIFFIRFFDCPAEINGLIGDKIYVYYRNAHHLGFFKSAEYFVSRHLGKVLLNTIFFMICLMLYRKSANTSLRKFNLFNIILYTLQCISLIIGIFDRDGVFLKSYPFRINTISTMMFFTTTLWYFNELNIQKIYSYLRKGKAFPVGMEYKIKGIFRAVAFLFVIFMLSDNTVHTIRKNRLFFCCEPFTDMHAYIREHTKKDDVFIFTSDCDRLQWDFIRKAERDRFVSYEFAPANRCQIYQWYQRIEERNKLTNDIHYITEIRTKYKIDYLITCKYYYDKNLFLVGTFNDKKLYRIESKPDG